MNRLWKLLALILALMLVAAACDDDDDAEEDDGATTTQADEGALPDLSGQSLEVAAIWTDTEQQRFEMVLAEFEERTGADISYTPAGDDMDVFLEGRIARGGQPDVAIIAQPALLRELAQGGNLVSIEESAGPVLDEFFDRGFREALSVDDTLYGVPFKTANKSLLWYNVAVLSDAGVEPPGTWADFVETSQAVADSGVTPVSVGGADGWTLTDWLENVLLWTAGPDAYDQLANGEMAWTDPAVTTALTTLGEIWTDDFVVGGLTGATSVGFDESVTQTWTAPAGFVFEGDFVAGIITGEEVASIGEDADFVPFPAVEAGGGGGGDEAALGQAAGDRIVLGGDFPVLLRDTEAGQALMQFLATADAQGIWAAEGGFLSSNTDVDPSVYPDDVTRRAAEMIREAELTRFDLSDQVPPEFGATVGQGMWSILQDFLSNPSNVEGIAQALEEASP